MYICISRYWSSRIQVSTHQIAQYFRKCTVRGKQREREGGEHVLMYMYMYLSFIRSQLMSLLKVMNNMSQNQTGQLKPYILIHKLKAALNGVCLAWPYLQPFNYVPLLY